MEIGGDGEVGTVRGSVTEKQEGNQQCFLCVFICQGSNGFSSLCKTSMECNQDFADGTGQLWARKGKGQRMPSSQGQCWGLCGKQIFTEHLRSSRKWADNRKLERSAPFQ